MQTRSQNKKMVALKPPEINCTGCNIKILVMEGYYVEISSVWIQIG
jgi:DNA-directed RNA polymerase subunit RPC12/RpoP